MHRLHDPPVARHHLGNAERDVVEGQPWLPDDPFHIRSEGGLESLPLTRVQPVRECPVRIDVEGDVLGVAVLDQLREEPPLLVPNQLARVLRRRGTRGAKRLEHASKGRFEAWRRGRDLNPR